MQAQVSRDDLQAAFDRHRMRHGLAKAQQRLADACGASAVPEVADDKIATGFDALAINPAVLQALGVAPLALSRFSFPARGQTVQARLGEIASAIYRD